MKAIEFLDLIMPEHDRSSCGDDNLFNGFHTGSFSPKYLGRCRRCMALEIINGSDAIPDERPLEIM